jgi:sporulation protein YlmC with PRC-barrel domain
LASRSIVDGVEHGEPIAYTALKPGADVISSDGEEVGKLEHVLADEEEDVFDGIVIDAKQGPGGHRFVDAPQVSECREGAVTISVAAADVEKLPEPTPNPAVMENHGVEDTEGKLREKLHRAWDMVSGNT